MPTDSLKSGAWPLDNNSADGNFTDQQLSQYYSAAASQYNQHYSLYNSPYYQFPYLPTAAAAAANTSAIYGHGYAAGFDYNSYPAAAYGVQYYNKTMASVAAGSSPISTFQQYTNNLAGSFNTLAAAAINQQQQQQSNSQHSQQQQQPTDAPNYYTARAGSIKVADAKPKKSKRKKQATASAKQEIVYKRLYIWELDEMFSDEFAHRLFYDLELKKLIGQILTVCFQLSSADEFDHTNIEDANVDETLVEQSAATHQQPSQTDYSAQRAEEEAFAALKPESHPHEDKSMMAGGLSALDNIKRMAASQQRIRAIYTQHQGDVGALIKAFALDIADARTLDALRRSDAERPYARCLRLVHERSQQGLATGAPQQANLLLTSDPLGFALAKLLVHGSSSFVPVDSVYSASRTDLSTTLDRIVARFKREKLVLISSKVESVQLARNLNIPVWPVTQVKDVENFYVALDRILC